MLVCLRNVYSLCGKKKKSKREIWVGWSALMKIGDLRDHHLAYNALRNHSKMQPTFVQILRFFQAMCIDRNVVLRRGLVASFLRV